MVMLSYMSLASYMMLGSYVILGSYMALGPYMVLRSYVILGPYMMLRSYMIRRHFGSSHFRSSRKSKPCLNYSSPDVSPPLLPSHVQ